jgi:PST family polysaccharide transporter
MFINEMPPWYIERVRYIIHQIMKTYKQAESSGSRDVVKNAFLLSGLQVISYLVPIIVIPYLFRALGPEKFGLIAFAEAFIHYFMILTDYAFNISATKEVSLARGDDAKISKIFCAVMIAKFMLLVLSGIILALVISFIPKFRHDAMLYILGFGAVIGSALFPTWLFQGIEKMKYIVRIKMFGEFAFAISILFFVKGPDDYLMIPILNSSIFCVTGLIGLIVVFWRVKLVFQFPDLKAIKHQFRAGKNLFFSIVAINAYTSTRVFAVGLLTNNTLTGFYSIAEKVANIAQTFPLSSFSQAIFPRLSHIYQRSQTMAFELMKQVQQITINLSLFTFPLIIIFAPVIIRLICGGDYPVAVLTLRLLMLGVCFISWNAFRVQFLLVSGHTDIYAGIHIRMAMIGLPLLLVSVYLFSYVGAAMATVLTEAGIFALTAYKLSKLQFKD